MSDLRPGNPISILDAYRSMRLFLYRFWERGDFRNDDLRNLLSWTSLRSWSQEAEEPFPGDPAQWPDWATAVRDALVGMDPDDFAPPPAAPPPR